MNTLIAALAWIALARRVAAAAHVGEPTRWDRSRGEYPRIKTARQTARCAKCKTTRSRLVVRVRRPGSTWPDYFDLEGGRANSTTCACFEPGYVLDDKTGKAVPGRVPKQIHYREIKGSYNADVACDARCTNAKGYSCECSCGGKNHGAGHG